MPESAQTRTHTVSVKYARWGLESVHFMNDVALPRKAFGLAYIIHGGAEVTYQT